MVVVVVKLGRWKRKFLALTFLSVSGNKFGMVMAIPSPTLFIAE
jgi:hypothetical protein